MTSREALMGGESPVAGAVVGKESCLSGMQSWERVCGCWKDTPARTSLLSGVLMEPNW
jgi:hypothetical protein